MIGLARDRNHPMIRLARDRNHHPMIGLAQGAGIILWSGWHRAGIILWSGWHGAGIILWSAWHGTTKNNTFGQVASVGKRLQRGKKYLLTVFSQDRKHPSIMHESFPWLCCHGIGSLRWVDHVGNFERSFRQREPEIHQYPRIKCYTACSVSHWLAVFFVPLIFCSTVPSRKYERLTELHLFALLKNINANHNWKNKLLRDQQIE